MKRKLRAEIFTTVNTQLLKLRFLTVVMDSLKQCGVLNQFRALMISKLGKQWFETYSSSSSSVADQYDLSRLERFCQQYWLKRASSTYVDFKSFPLQRINCSSFRLCKTNEEVVLFTPLLESCLFDTLLERRKHILRFPGCRHTKDKIHFSVPFFFEWTVRKVICNVLVKSIKEVCEPSFYLLVGNDVSTAW